MQPAAYEAWCQHFNHALRACPGADTIAPPATPRPGEQNAIGPGQAIGGGIGTIIGGLGGSFVTPIAGTVIGGGVGASAGALAGDQVDRALELGDYDRRMGGRR